MFSSNLSNLALGSRTSMHRSVVRSPCLARACKTNLLVSCKSSGKTGSSKTSGLAANNSSTVAGTRVRFAGVQVCRRAGQRNSFSRQPKIQIEANLFTRLYRVVKATIDNFVSSAEDPEILLDRVVQEMNEDATRMRQASAQALASQRQITARYDNVQSAADQWLKRAELAVRQGEDELAKEALRRRKTLQGDADRLKMQADQQKNATNQLMANVRMLENKISEARGKKETLKARAASAKTSKAIQELVGGMRSSSASSFAAFDKMEEKVMALEAEAESTAALATPDNLEQRFAKLEGGSVDDELKALKQGVRSEPQRALPRYQDMLQTDAPKEPVDLELEELRRKTRGY